MSNYIILKPGPEDWEKVRDLRLLSLNDSPQAFGQTSDEAMEARQEEWQNRLRKGQYLCAKLLEDESFIGIVCVFQEMNQKSKHIATINSVYVTREMRGQGIGKALMKAVIQDVEMSLPEVIKLELRVAKTQIEALALYKTLGFNVIGLLEKEMYVDGEYIDEYEMHKFIRSV